MITVHIIHIVYFDLGISMYIYITYREVLKQIGSQCPDWASQHWASAMCLVHQDEQIVPPGSQSFEPHKKGKQM